MDVLLLMMPKKQKQKPHQNRTNGSETADDRNFGTFKKLTSFC